MPQSRLPLAEFLENELKEKGPLSKGALVQAAQAAGYPVDGRNVHATLVNIKRSGRVAEDADGIFSAIPLEMEPAKEASLL